MKCPKCDKDMRVTYSDISSNNRNGRKYDRTYYTCDTDDVWLSVEIPRMDDEAAMITPDVGAEPAPPPPPTDTPS
ncbi:MAG TPA: hypothetical protein VGS28_03345 [Candidatus Saccharimonadales bacterium]|nr:hypothetical protein [Candidatus Saccharimonadales bacterium]